MKKILLLIACVVVTYAAECFAQTTATNKTSAKVVVPEIDVIKAKAETWFKDVYVEQFFKDPYSYRLMSIKATPVTAKEAFIKELAIIQNRIDICTVHENDRTQEQLDKCMRLYKDSRLNIQKEQEFIDKEIDVEYHTKKIAIYKEYSLKYLNLAEPIELYLLDTKAKEALEQIIKAIPQEDADKLAFYDINLDCYSKNSLGNEVLGRFVFPFTTNGPRGDKNGVDKVINKNK